LLQFRFGDFEGIAVLGEMLHPPFAISAVDDAVYWIILFFAAVGDPGHLMADSVPKWYFGRG